MSNGALKSCNNGNIVLSVQKLQVSSKVGFAYRPCLFFLLQVLQGNFVVKLRPANLRDVVLYWQVKLYI